eukprot:g8294.t1
MFGTKFEDLLGFVKDSNNGSGLQPSSDYLYKCLIILQSLCIVWWVFVSAKGKGGMKPLIQDFGVRVRKVRKVAGEIERKMFHLSGVGVPLLWQYLESKGYDRHTLLTISWSVVAVGWTADVARVYIPFVQRNWPLKKILREKEYGQLCGAAYFSLGTITSFTLFPPGIATTATLWLVLGDLSAALIGVSFGGDAVVVKLGREGKKSLEGSAAMFIVCFLTGMVIFQEVPLCEYGVFFGSLVATLTELYEPFGFNDNFTIPIFSALALHWGLLRVGNLC